MLGGGGPPLHAPTMMSLMNSNPVSLRASQQQQISADVSRAVGAGKMCVDERERERGRERGSVRERGKERERYMSDITCCFKNPCSAKFGQDECLSPSLETSSPQPAHF